MKYSIKKKFTFIVCPLLVLPLFIAHAGQLEPIPSLAKLCKNVLKEKAVPPLPQVEGVDFALLKTIANNPTEPDIAVIEDLLKQGADPNFEHPLYYRLSNENLLAAPRSMAGMTPLGILSTQKQFNQKMQNVASLCLNYGADINQKIALLHPPLGFALKAFNTGFVYYALKNGAHPCAVDRFNALEYAIQSSLMHQSACFKNMIVLLLKSGCDNLFTDCIVKAIQKNNEPMFDILNYYNTSVPLRQIRFQDNKTIFHIAATSNNCSLRKKVFSHARSNDLHIPDHDGKTSLHILQECTHNEIQKQHANSAGWLAKVFYYLCP